MSVHCFLICDSRIAGSRVVTTLADLDPQALAPVLDVPSAGALLGLGASLSWRLSRERGELAPGVPVLALGRRRVVPTAAVLRALGIE